ncbi:Phenylalanine--tRNA ligase [Fusarium oxysporum f. sp. albedinis]|nr:Phenylalanine--tRNA ligase [Fusarium oxysporum f. sp. albedinis]
MLLGLLTMPNSCIVLVVAEPRLGFRSRRIIGSLELSIKSLHVATGHSSQPQFGTCTIRQKARKAEQQEKWPIGTIPALQYWPMLSNNGNQ